MKKRIISCILSVMLTLNISTLLPSAAEEPRYSKDNIMESSNNINYSSASSENDNNSVLPKEIDNSKTKYFPEITDQIGGTCAAYSIVYYQATYTVNKAKDIASNCDENILSPIFAFNMCNGENSSGANAGDVVFAMQDIGCPSIKSVTVDNEEDSTYYTSWYPTKEIWTEAQLNRLSGYEIIDFDNTYDSLNEIKKIIAGGDVLSFGTNTNKWYQKDIADVPCNKNYIGQKIVPYCSSPYNMGGHGLTIVGYDDNIWYDINNNGTEDEGEKGAFKVANSWGKDWGNDGFMWLSYDALLVNLMYVICLKILIEKVHLKRISINYIYLNIKKQNQKHMYSLH